MFDCEDEEVFSATCTSRLIFDQIADKWSMMVLAVLDRGPARFNGLKRRLEGVSQKALTTCLRRLERAGIVSRHVVTASPIAVEYRMTPLGRSLQPVFRALYDWTIAHGPEVEAAQARYDQRGEDGDDT